MASGSAPALSATDALATLPSGLRSPLIKSLDEIVRNYRAGRWEPSELNGGKLCEVVYTILRGHADGALPSKPSKPKNMVDACTALEGAGAHLPRSLRVQIPRV